MIRYTVILLCLLCLGCTKIKLYPDKPIGDVTTKVIGHRGGNSPYKENTLAAVGFAFRYSDGVEVDVMLSKDRTLWLSHSPTFPECGGRKMKCFAETTDDEIEELDRCLGPGDDYTKLEEVFALMRDSFSDKLLVLDCKGWEPCDMGSLNIIDGLNIVADEIVRLTKEYHLERRVVAEAMVFSFLNRIKRKGDGIGVYFDSFGDLERGTLYCLREKYDGLVFKYGAIESLTKEHVDMMHRKGLRIQVFSVPDTATVNKIKALGVDVIQADVIR